MTEPTNQELLRLHDEAANAGMHADGLRDWDAYDGVNDDGLRAVWRAGFQAGRVTDKIAGHEGDQP